MTRRRRRWFREETVAPWLTMVVIVALWWTGARLAGIDPARPREPMVRAPRADDALPAVDGDRHVAMERPALVATRDAPSDTGGEGSPLGRAALDDLLLPVAGVQRSSLRASFDEARGTHRRHEAIDILAPRGTAVYAALDGRVAKLFTSAAGGLTIYQFDPAGEYALYYAHLDAYAPDLTEGQPLVRGQTIGYVGTTGNAPPGTPHLHFAIFKLGPERRWWEGDALDPFPLLTRAN
jgi:murein DD-endopeptidase MepM/ murein hydrolase activator NlpD